MTGYMWAPEVEEIAGELIDTVEAHADLSAVRIRFIFRSDVPKSHGRLVLGRARKISGLAAWLATGGTEDMADPRPFFVVEISEPTWRRLDREQKRALVDHELCHLVVDVTTDEPTLSMRGHDFEEFSQILRRHGLWSSASKGIGQVVAEQLAMAVDEITAWVEGRDVGPSAGPDTTGGGDAG